MRDFSPLRPCTALQHLNLHGTYVSNIDNLECPQLRTLVLSETDISSIAPLQAMPKITELDLAQTYVFDISLLRHAHALVALDLRHTLVCSEW